MAASLSPASVRPDILAVSPAGVVGSRANMDHASNTQARLQRAKERLYVLCQAGGWTFFLTLQIVFIALFRNEHITGKSTQPELYLSLVRVVA